jgi:hypothetical protein
MELPPAAATISAAQKAANARTHQALLLFFCMVNGPQLTRR